MPRKKKPPQTSLFSEETKINIEAPMPRKGRPASPKHERGESLAASTRSTEIFSVADYLTHLSDLVGAEEVVVQGEISGYKTHPAGAFFALKDQEGDGLLRCYMPPRYLHQLGFGLEDGLLVQASGVASIYRPRGELSFTVSSVSLVGDGSLRQAYEALKKKLEEEGLFARKRELPEFIHRLGLVTAKTGEVIHDFQRNLKPLGFEVELLSVRVQGSDAPPQIVEAIQTFNKRRSVEVIIVMRGGGSLEDLQAFNDERVARAIFKSDIPVLAAIGHDRDVPIASLTADLFVSTPSIAAITINRSWERLENSLPTLRSELVGSFEAVLEEKKNAVSLGLERLIHGTDRLLQKPKEFRRRLQRELLALEKRKTEIHLGARREISVVVQSLGIRLRQIKEIASSVSVYLQGVSPERNLRLGYSIVMNAEGGVVKRTDNLDIGQELETLLADGSFVSKVEAINKKKSHEQG